MDAKQVIADQFLRSSDDLADWYRSCADKWRAIGNGRMVLLADLARAAIEDYAEAFKESLLTPQQESVQSDATEEDRGDD